jgi:sodium transport system permease protein
MEKLAERRPGLESLIERWKALSPVAILLALAVAPAVCEEFFFRGYLLGALRGRLPAWAAIGLTGVVFGLFHASVFGMIAIERVLSSALLGFALGWICWTTRSVLPGMLVHMLNNGLMLSLAYWGHRLQALGWDAEKQRYLPLPLVAATTAVATLALVLIAWTGRRNSHHT